jgi:hypothetical protein
MVLPRSLPRPRLRRQDRILFSEAACQEHCLSVVISSFALPLLREGDERVWVVLVVRGLSSFSSRCQWRVATRPRMMVMRASGGAIWVTALHISQEEARAHRPFTPSHSGATDQSTPPLTRLGGPAGRQRSAHFGRVIDTHPSGFSSAATMSSYRGFRGSLMRSARSGTADRSFERLPVPLPCSTSSRTPVRWRDLLSGGSYPRRHGTK